MSPLFKRTFLSISNSQFHACAPQVRFRERNNHRDFPSIRSLPLSFGFSLESVLKPCLLVLQVRVRERKNHREFPVKYARFNLGSTSYKNV